MSSKLYKTLNSLGVCARYILDDGQGPQEQGQTENRPTPLDPSNTDGMTQPDGVHRRLVSGESESPTNGRRLLGSSQQDQRGE